jgi:hypothetical protein
LNLLFAGGEEGRGSERLGRRETREGVTGKKKCVSNNESWVRENRRAKNGLNGEGERQTDGRIDWQNQWTAKGLTVGEEGADEKGRQKCMWVRGREEREVSEEREGGGKRGERSGERRGERRGEKGERRGERRKTVERSEVVGRRGTVYQMEAGGGQRWRGKRKRSTPRRLPRRQSSTLTESVYDCCLFGQIYVKSLQKREGSEKVEGREGGRRNNLVVKFWDHITGCRASDRKKLAKY